MTTGYGRFSGHSKIKPLKMVTIFHISKNDDISQVGQQPFERRFLVKISDTI